MRPALDNSDAEIDALQTLCERLGGFDDRVSLEWLDGCMAALLCGPRRMEPQQWLPMLLGDAWERTFADPPDVQQATQTLARRWQVLASQLDAEALFDDPDGLRLSPLMSVLDVDERDRLLAAGEITADEATAWPLTGETWAQGVLDAIELQAGGWVPPTDDAEDFAWYDGCLRAIEALMIRDPARRAEDLKRRYPGREPSRDELIDDACMALQDLRCYWVEHAPRPPTRRVAAVPGRNDPCPCGSGRKYKKCHGAG